MRIQSEINRVKRLPGSVYQWIHSKQEKAFVFVANGFACAKEDIHHVMDGFLKAQLGMAPKTQTHRK